MNIRSIHEKEFTSFFIYCIINWVNDMCIFCKIVNGEIPSYTIYEDETVKCFLDINPDSNGHTLIIPKKHFTNLDDIDLETLNHIFEVAKVLKKRLEDKLNIDGLTLIQNNDDIQEVKHFHMHLKPYYNDSLLVDAENIYEILKEA